MFFKKNIPDGIISKLKSKSPLFNQQTTPEQERLVLLGVMTFAEQFKAFAKHVKAKDTLRVYVANADYCTLAINGQHFQFINALLGTDLHFEFHLISPDHTMLYDYNYTVHPEQVDPKISIYNQEISLENYIERNGLPDILTINNLPILDDYEFPQWFLPESAIQKCIQAEIPVFGASTGKRAYELESAALSGMQLYIADDFVNPIHYPFSKLSDSDTEKQLIHESGDLDWSRVIWRLTNANTVFTQEKFDTSLHEDLMFCLSSIAHAGQTRGILPHLHTHPSLTNLRLGVTKQHKTGRYLAIMADFVLDMHTNAIYRDFGESETPYKSNIEFYDDRIEALSAKRSLTREALTSLKIMREHLSEEALIYAEQWYSEHSALNAFAETLEKQADYTQSERDIEIEEMIRAKDYDSITDLTKEELLNFRDDTGGNFIHTAAAFNDIKLVNLGINTGASVSHVDMDNFNLLDICSECHSYEAAETILSSPEGKALLNVPCPAFGLTSMHRVGLRGTKDLAELYAQHGGDLEATDSLGRTARSIFKERGFI